MILRSVLIVVFLVAPALTPAYAEEDHDRAHSALAQGAILPLSTILPELQRQFGARLLSVELDEERNRLVYEFELITPRGQILDVHVDAATGTVVDPGRGPREQDRDDD